MEIEKSLCIKRIDLRETSIKHIKNYVVGNGYNTLLPVRLLMESMFNFNYDHPLGLFCGSKAPFRNIFSISNILQSINREDIEADMEYTKGSMQLVVGFAMVDTKKKLFYVMDNLDGAMKDLYTLITGHVIAPQPQMNIMDQYRIYGGNTFFKYLYTEACRELQEELVIKSTYENYNLCGENPNPFESITKIPKWICKEWSPERNTPLYDRHIGIIFYVDLASQVFEHVYSNLTIMATNPEKEYPVVIDYTDESLNLEKFDPWSLDVLRYLRESEKDKNYNY